LKVNGAEVPDATSRKEQQQRTSLNNAVNVETMLVDKMTQIILSVALTGTPIQQNTPCSKPTSGEPSDKQAEGGEKGEQSRDTIHGRGNMENTVIRGKKGREEGSQSRDTSDPWHEVRKVF
jgi:hypothetical protein